MCQLSKKYQGLAIVKAVKTDFYSGLFQKEGDLPKELGSIPNTRREWGRRAEKSGEVT